MKAIPTSCVNVVVVISFNYPLSTNPTFLLLKSGIILSSFWRMCYTNKKIAKKFPVMANYGKYYIAVRLLLLKQYLEANAGRTRIVKRQERKGSM